MISKKKIVAVIPARSGSKGVPNKNIRLLNEIPLIAYSIAAGIRSQLIERVIVSTDSSEYAKIAKKYNAVCTPDFFGYNSKLELEYRGRIRELKELKPASTGDGDLKIAMNMIANTSKGPKNQIPSMGCSIKWFN